LAFAALLTCTFAGDTAVSQPSPPPVPRSLLTTDYWQFLPMIRVGCDVHRWMTAWVGVVSHPYFAVSDTKTGTFTIANVPAGRRSLTVWHESFGALTKSVDVKDGQTVTVDFAYVQKAQ
jgi:hypothetical protein